VTPKCPVDWFDHHSAEHAADPGAAAAQMLQGPPVKWSDRYGGFWIVSRYADVVRVARDDASFSSRQDFPDEGVSFTGVTIPGGSARTIPISLDPPAFFAFRRLLNPVMSPQESRKLAPMIAAYADWCIDRVIESGSADLVADIASPVPAITTLRLLGLPLDAWKIYADAFHNSAASRPGSPELAQADADAARGMDLVMDMVRRRRAEPKDDLISKLARALVDGRPLTDDEIRSVCYLVLGGGVDTTTALIAHSLQYLDEHRDLRPGLLADPGKLHAFGEEMLRVHTPTQALARTATIDVEVGGQLIRAGDRVMLFWAAANRDPEEFDDPETVRIERHTNRHASFGFGIHRCVGSTLARTEFAEVLSRILTRMPDYELVGTVVRYDSVGTINGLHRLPARFTPRTRSGPGGPPPADLTSLEEGKAAS
jgi:cytochrome P450